MQTRQSGSPYVLPDDDTGADQLVAQIVDVGIDGLLALPVDQDGRRPVDEAEQQNDREAEDRSVEQR